MQHVPESIDRRKRPCLVILIIGEYHIIDYIGVICAYSTLINHINVDPREIIVPDSLTKLKA